MTQIKNLILLWLFQVYWCYRSYKVQFNKSVFGFICPLSSQYFPDIYPHRCLSISKACKGTTEFKLAYFNNREMMCNPRLQSYELGPSNDSREFYGKYPYTMIYSYDEYGNLMYSTEAILSLSDNYCKIGQKYSGIYKCQYCQGQRFGENCASTFAQQPCGANCKTCTSTNTKCASCLDGYSPLSSTDFKCSLKCLTGHKTCLQNQNGYSLIECMDGYELLNGDCVQCPTNCKVCLLGDCQECMFLYTLKNSKCLGDENCMKYNYIYDTYGVAIDTDCEQCDFGFFKKGTRCASCQLEPGLEFCFICHNANECKSCFSEYDLTNDKKCELTTIQCNPKCQTCYVTDPNYCTTCFYEQKWTARIIPGKCVCDQDQGYADLNGECILCSNGYCQTCTLIFGECTSCDPLQNRILVGNTCPCFQGYYDPGLQDKICQKCYPSCYNCSGPYENECTDCGDPNIYHKQLVGGKCICEPRTIEIIESSVLTKCLICHPKCEKCQLPYDNSTNQYCTMCIPGQNRVVSDDLKCVCRSGYGEDGIVDICFKCHYSCQSCNGPLSTNCTKCSSQNLRYLNTNSECQCEDGYQDKGNNDMLCYLTCHHSCLSCNEYGEDLCTSCPSTREPDRVGTTFKCLCKDSHTYNDENQLECLECHFKCKTCNGINETNCLTCDLNYRQLIISKCECPYGYYDVGLIECQKCYYTCMTCFGSLIDNCITCSNSSNRIVKANKCVCKDQHLEKEFGDQICLKCSYRCASCIGTIDNCVQCPEFSFRELGVDNSCLCPPKSYDEPGNPQCIICHNTCLTCIGSQSNQCLTCNEVTKRSLNISGECLCDSKYYDSGQSECQACSNVCLECQTSADNCISCQPDKYLNGNSCICRTKLQGSSISKYQTSNSMTCQSCHYSCLNCTGRSSNECNSCWDLENRILQGKSCVCMNNYFDIGKPKCQQCNYRCQNCSISETLCLSCPPLSLRILINSQCLCPDGYYDDGKNSICQQCHYSCKTCTQIATKCVSCSGTSQRFFDSVFNSCLCKNTYYDAGVEICSLCHHSCLTCNGQQYNQCISCIDQNVSFRVYNEGICQCLIGYYDDGSSIYCKKCEIQCLSCEFQSHNCTQCSLTRHLNGNQCDCDSNYFETGQEYCQKCDQSCVNCVTNSTMCTECDSSIMKILDKQTSKCICQVGTTEINGVCQQCDITCKTCLNQTSNCTSCGQMKQLQNNNCICVEGTYEVGTSKECMLCNKTCLTCINQANYCLTCSVDNFRIFIPGNQCACKDGYFEDLSQQCVKCHQSCLTCQGSSQYCLSCDPLLSLELSNQNSCICKSSYYFNPSSKLCEACNITCKECQSAAQCIECEPLTRYYDGDTFSCQCREGFFEMNQKQCSNCDPSCKTCNTQFNCLTCESTYFRVLKNLNQCVCQDGYFDVGIEMCQKCNSKCKTCQAIATKCFSCFENEQIRVLEGNQCKCKAGYYDNGQLICEKCSKSCLTCQGKKDYCTSCDINQYRIDQSAIHKCPCLSNFFQNEEELCEKCHIKCSGCIQKRDKCVSCQYSNNANRLSISQNCDCKDGYYDDGVKLQCQKCNHQCRTCFQTADNCSQCFGNLREGAPACLCKAGYFEDEELNCLACANQCDTCEKQSSNCTSCKKNRTNKTCDCQEGYFEAEQPDCLKCEFQCQTCENYQSNCIICKGNRINNPICHCQDGYYEDYQSLNCSMCDSNCKTCNQEGCVTCNGNRLLSSNKKTCDCPENSIGHQDTPWCSNCEVAVLDIRFSDDLLYIIVEFDFPLNPNSFLNYLQQNDCLTILDTQTIKQLGNNPQCLLNLEDDKQLFLQLGQNASILPNDPIIFVKNSFRHKNCTNKLNSFIFNTIKYPLIQNSPQIEYDLPQYLLNPCDDNVILIKTKIYDGLRIFKSISWFFSVEGDYGNGNLEQLVVDQTTFQQLELMLPSYTLPKQSQITFYIEYQNFINKQAQSQFQVYTHSGQFPTVLWLGRKQYYTFEIIDFLFRISKRNCSSQTQFNQEDNSIYDVTFFESHRNDSNSRSSESYFSKNISENNFNLTIQKFTLTPQTAYTFSVNTEEKISNFSNSQNITIQILKRGLLCVFDNTKKIQHYRKDLIINIKCRDIDTIFDWNEDSDIKIEVKCLDLTQNQVCLDVNKKIIQVNKTDTIQIIKKMTVEPYTIQAWIVLAEKQQQSYQFQENIVFLENEVKILDVQYSKGYSIRPINNYETLQFYYNVSLEDKLYLLQYQIAIIYDFEIIKILEPTSEKYNFRLFDHFQQFQKGESFYLKFLAQFTNEIIPHQQDLKLTLNQPPICSINLQQKTFQALSSQKIVANCEFSDDYPFKYQLRFFMSEQDYQNFLNKLTDYSLILNSFQRYNYFEAYLPYCQGIALIQIMDSRGSITNIEQRLNLQKALFNCSDYLQKNFTYQYQIIQLLEIILNHFDQADCAKFSEQLIMKIKSYLDSEDLFDQLLALQTIKLYKRFKVNLENVNSSSRLLAQTKSESCFDNTSKLFYIDNSGNKLHSSNNISYYIQEFQELNNSVTKIFMKAIMLENEINQDDIFINEQLFQQKEQITNSLDALILVADDLFLKIAQTSAQFEEDKKKIIVLSKNLLNLIEEILHYSNAQVPVNGQVFTINGQVLQYQSAKMTKDAYNQQEGLDKDITDGYIVFVQKEQLNLYFNYLNISEQNFTEIKDFLNYSNLEIDQNVYAQTKLRNFLQRNQFRDYERLNTHYFIDITKYSYCIQDSVIPKYHLQCLQYNSVGNLQQCNLQVQDVKYMSARISCQCPSLGIIFLIRYQNQTQNDLEQVEILKNNQTNLGHCYFYHQPFFYVHGIFIVIILFIYFWSLIRELKKIPEQNIDTETLGSPNDQAQQKNTQIFCYPGNLIVYKYAIKFIHEFLCLFYCEEKSIPKSYKILKLSILLMIQIPLSLYETLLIEIVTLIPLLFLNYIILLLLRAVLKIFEAIYRFQGILGIAIITGYILLHLFSFALLISELQKRNKCNLEIENMSILIGSTIGVSYIIFDPITIYIRVLLYKQITSLFKEKEINPINRFFFFFIHHYKLQQIFENYTII
ncbi:unnamed protein product [Paramecium primaurelia]|uniref:EGF-like domain-containing protein n=1 Tax=Paramecium primaurelia TaxID=5886 RepID=A0A8S1NDC0_PARPR|nr:unnamed protein product [Paramecium primaurelia]